MQRIGHRGAKAYEAENTIASIKKAIELGDDAVEIDVHTCKTGEIVVIHDKTINRTTTGKGTVRKLSLDELQKHTSNGNPIPTLKEVMLFCEGKCAIHIELKGKGTAEKVASIIEDAVKKTSWTYGALMVSSFVVSRLEKVRLRDPNIKLGIITSKKPSKALRKAVKLGCESVYINFKRIKPHIIRIAKLKKINVYAWTVNKPKHIKEIKTLGVYGIITDVPDLV